MAKFDLIAALEIMKGVTDPKKALPTVQNMLQKFLEVGQSVTGYKDQVEARSLEITHAAAAVKIAQITGDQHKANEILVIALSTMYALGYSDAEKASAEKLTNS